MGLRSRSVAIAAGAVLVVGLPAAGAAGASSHSGADTLASATATARMAALAPTFQPASSETAFLPITPCRIVDTRSGTGANGTPLGNHTIRPYYVGGTFGFAPQGGKSGGCGIPVGATAIAATLTAVTPTHSGFLRAWPNGLSEPRATLLNYAGSSIGSGATVSLNASSAMALRVRNYGGPTDLVIDVFGYYVKPLAVMVSSGGALYAGSSRGVSASRASLGVYDVVFDRNIRYCTAEVTVYNSGYFGSASTYYGSNSSSVRVYIWTAAGAPADQYFYLVVDC
ncbi:hypothetical protein [Nakamurella lactea]|uniref:hypothetical protein n=1 Tax=Nakamurella lactea TaxID=459515 RepID=UPI0004142091|nr:hypothetical protein [Nakamurella lactea]